MNLSPDDRIKISQVIASCWAMPEFKQRFLDDPRAVLREAGVEIPPEVEVRVAADTEQHCYVVLPRPDLPQFLAGLLPRSAGKEVRLVQNDATHLYLPLPMSPMGMISAMQTDMEGPEPLT